MFRLAAAALIGIADPLSVPSVAAAVPAHGIEGGTPDADDTFPTTVLVRPHIGLCSGVAISNKLVLTAAHCLEDLRFGQQLGVYPGAVVADQELRQTVDYWVHPDYCGDCEHDRFDFGLIELREALSDLPFPGIPATPDEYRALVNLDAPVTTVGYGLTGDGTAAGIRQILEQTVTGATPSQHEFSTSGAGGVCDGDSGAPVFVMQEGVSVLVGISARATDTKCDGGATLRAGSTTAALCWLAEHGYDEPDRDPAFCLPDPDRAQSCGGCDAGRSPAMRGWLLLLLGAVLRRRRPACC